MKTTAAYFCSLILALALLLAVSAFAAAPPPSTAPPPAASSTPKLPPTDAELYEAGKTLFDALAPPEIKERFYFPTREEWDQFATRLQATMESGSMAELADLEPQARAAQAALRALGGYEDYADWLEARIDEIEAAKEAQKIVPTPPMPPPKPGEKPPRPAVAPSVPLYDLWLARMRPRPVPARAAALLPGLKAAFLAEGLPTALVWLAETESGFNPAARSPAGARGLFQLMPATARELGLSTTLPDERTDPEKNARASARMLRRLHGRFGSWPLALAAYNAGEGRVSRLLDAARVKTFAGIAEALPTETRLYVPKVLATLTVREGVAPDGLPAPTPKPPAGTK